jgi:hypothetical protein
MKKPVGNIAFGLFISVAVSFATAAMARPPTVQNSPGYDARLAESRKAQAEYMRTTPGDTAKPLPKPVKRKRVPRNQAVQ